MKYFSMIGWLIIYGLLFLLATVIGGFIIAAYYLMRSLSSGDALPLDTFIIQNLGLLLIISGVVMLIFSILVPLLRGYQPLKYLNFRALPLKHSLISVAMGIGIALFINSFFTFIDVEALLPEHYMDPLEGMLGQSFWLLLLAVGVVAPIYEEVMLRGLVFEEMRGTLKLWIALVLQGLIFGLIHGNLFQFSYAFPAGILLGVIYLKYRSMWAPILVHIAWNSTSLIMGVLITQSSHLIASFVAGLVLIATSAYSIFKLEPPLRSL